MDLDDLNKTLESHALWLRDEGGERADLTGANLRRADLSGANLSEANLSDANLRCADLSCADLSGANLSGAILCKADLSGASLIWANMRRANLSKANLSDANLRCADLSCADLSCADLITLHIGPYEAYIAPKTSLIGCELRDNSAWLSATSDEIENLEDGAGKLWEQYGEVVRAAIRAIETSKK